MLEPRLSPDILLTEITGNGVTTGREMSVPLGKQFSLIINSKFFCKKFQVDIQSEHGKYWDGQYSQTAFCENIYFCNNCMRYGTK